MTAPVLTPSPARTVHVGLTAGTANHGVRVAAMPLSWPDKAAIETLDYSLDLSAWLGDAGADTIAGSVICAAAPTGTASDLVLVVAATTPAGLATLLISGGQAELDYLVSFLVTTAAGRTALFEVSLRITDAAPGP